MFVGVNGVGKTTTIGKIAWKMKEEGKKVLLVAADTFRAGAVEQLHLWSEKVGVDFYGKEEGCDPASVVYDGCQKAKEEDYDVVLIDTAGRLQNKVNLMKELEKMNKLFKELLRMVLMKLYLLLMLLLDKMELVRQKLFKKLPILQELY